MGFSNQEYWSGLPCLPPGDLPDPGIEPTFPVSPALQANSLSLNYQGNPQLGITIKYIAFNLPAMEQYAEPDVEIELDEYRSYGRSKRSSLETTK